MQRARVATQCRSASGSALSETGPAFFLFFIFMLFPVIDVIAMGASYAGVHTLNDLQLREASRLTKSQVLLVDGAVQSSIPLQWRQTVLAFLTDPNQDIQTSVDYHVGESAVYVSVTTAVTFHPLLTIPFFNAIPGLGAPFTFTVGGSRPLENPQFYLY